jgi:hypothetical protein
MDEAVATSPTLLPDSLNSSSSLRFPSLHFECYLTPPSSLPGTRQEVAGVGPLCIRCRSTSSSMRASRSLACVSRMSDCTT